VSEYWGDEVPDAESFGWKPKQIYKLYRDPAALKAATAGLEGKPLLLEHRPITAGNHPKQITIGTISNPSFENGTVYGDLIIWDQAAIDAIEGGELPALSCGYRYVCDPRLGTAPDGERYDGRMTTIQFNHIALVENPRVEGAVVADSVPGFSLVGLKIGEKHMKSIRKAFGLDGPACRAKDETPLSKLDGPKAVQDADNDAAELMEILKGALSPAVFERVCELLAKPDEGEGRRADNDPRPALAKHDNYEPDASDDEEEMRPNGLQRSRHDLSDDERPVDATSLRENLLRVARNLAGEKPGRRPAESGAGAMDEAAEASFRARFPNLPRNTSGGVVFCQSAEGRTQFQPRQPIAADSSASASFFDRFPNAARITR
jgi:hypothetical protein